MIHNKSLKVQLSATFIALFVLLIFLGLFSLSQLADVDSVSLDIREHWLQSTRVLGDINNFTSDFRAAEASHLLSSTPDLMHQADQELAGLAVTIAEVQSNYEKIRHTPVEMELYQKFSRQWNDYQTLAQQVIELSNQGNKAAGTALYVGASQHAYSKASDTLGELTSRTVVDASNASSRAAATHVYARTLIIVALLLAVLGMAAVLNYINRSISRPLIDLAKKMRAIAANDLDVEINGIHRQDEIGEMARAIVVFRNNAADLAVSQRGLIQQASMLEEKLQYEQKLATLQRNFLSMASHEFRTPLTIIDGHAQRLTKMKSVLLPEQIQERSDKIRNAVLRMTSVIDNLLTSSRLFDSEPELYFHPKVFNLTEMLDEVCNLHREISSGTQIIDKLGADPLPFLGDPQLLFQTFSNLLSNAIKYSPGDGKVTIVVEETHQQVVVRVTDNGIGIPSRDLEHLFERYHRGSNVSGITGTGIGLFLVKTVVNLHQGTVSVSSEVGRGSEFVVLLPKLGT